jgi:hypothetical protein
MNDYLSLLLKYQTLPRIRRSATFMEIAGYPHYENVCSNILKFFLEPAEEHGFGNLLLKAFLKMAGKELLSAPDQATISREYQTEQGTRIDLVVNTDVVILGIENKIYHWEANDFNIYARTLDALGADKEVIKAVLCLEIDPCQAEPSGGFVRYTYLQLWFHVRELMGHHLQQANPKWISYLNDFMETTIRLTGETQEEQAVADFFAQHHDLVERLVMDRQRILDRLSRTIRNIRERVRSEPDLLARLGNNGIWQTFTLANQLTISGSIFSTDLNAGIQGWTLEIFPLKNASVELFSDLMRKDSLAVNFPAMQIKDHRATLQQWNLNAPELELGDSLIQAIKSMIAIADSLHSNLPN